MNRYFSRAQTRPHLPSYHSNKTSLSASPKYAQSHRTESTHDMSAQKYTPLAADPGTAHTCPCGTAQQPHWARRRSVWLLTALCLETLLLLGIAYYAALAYAPSSSHRGNSTGLLDPQSFLPPSKPPWVLSPKVSLTVPVPLQTVIFEDGTPYRDIGPPGDKLWNDMMPSNFPSIQTRDPS